MPRKKFEIQEEQSIAKKIEEVKLSPTFLHDQYAEQLKKYVKDPQSVEVKEICDGCNHPRFTHYGSELDNCNLKKCRCQGWKS